MMMKRVKVLKKCKTNGKQRMFFYVEKLYILNQERVRNEIRTLSINVH